MAEKDKPDAQKGDPKSAAVQPAPKKHTPKEWAHKLGLFHKADPRLPQQRDTFDWRHAAASELWGWERHAYHYQTQPFEITEEVYKAALAAAAQYPCCELPKDAIPQSQVDRFADFKPRKARDKKASKAEERS